MDARAEELKERTKRFALRVIRLVRALPRTHEARIIGDQLLRASTSMAANYRAVWRARSKADFISKIGVVVEESDETVFWLELLVDAETIPARRMDALLDEARQLVAIFGASQRTARLPR